MPPRSNLWREAKRAGLVFANPFSSKKQRHRPKDVKGVRKGNFVKRKIPPRKKPAKVPKLPPIGPQTVPQPLIQPPPPPTPSSPTNRAYEWLQQNAAVLILNFGSLCTLTGFMRSDVLELRAFSMTGSLCSVAYFFSLHPLRWTPIAWSSLFATVNGFNIYKILYERKAKVVLSEFEEDVYVEHFMPHGVTPKQFEFISKKATLVKCKKGDYIIKQGEPLQHVYLIVSGKTRASFLGRKLTALTTSPGDKERRTGGDAGAWVGEMSFLERFGAKEMNKQNGTPKNGGGGDDFVTDRRLGTAIYTIVADSDDCELLVWSHDDIEELMHQSTDLRASMTRAMTAPIVGKVINFTLSRGKYNKPTWSTWLDDWKNSGAGTSVTVVRKQLEEEGGDEDDDIEVEPPIM